MKSWTRTPRRAAIGLAVVATAAALGARQLPTFRGGADLVLVDVYPQRDGKIVEGLTAADFEVFEDGKPQRIEQFEFVRVESGRFDGERTDPQTVDEALRIAADPHTRLFVTYLDEAHTTVDGSNRIRKPLVDMLDRAMGRDDLFGVAKIRMRPQDIALGRRLGSIDRQMEKYWTWGLRQRVYQAGTDPVEDMLNTCFHRQNTIQSPPWLVKDGNVTRYLDETLIDRRREEQTLKSIGTLVRYLGELREARSVLIVVSDGWQLFPPNPALQNEPAKDERMKSAGIPRGPLGPRPGDITSPGTAGRMGNTDDIFPLCIAELNRLAEYDGDRELRALLAVAERYNVSVYPVASGGLAAFDTSLGQYAGVTNQSELAAADRGRLAARVAGLRTLAENTGGLAIVNTNDLQAGLRSVADDVSAYYLLGYPAGKDAKDERFHRIEVKLKQPGLNVRARRGYVARRAEVLTSRGAGAGVPGAAAAAPAVAAIEVLARVPATADLFISGRAANGEVAVVAELGARAAGQPEWQKGGRVTVTLTAANGQSLDPVVATFAATSRGVLLRVPTQAAGPWQVTVRAEAGTASFQDSVRVMADAGESLAPALAFRATPSPRSPLNPAADRQFYRSERLHLELAAESVPRSTAVRLLDRRGQALPLSLTASQEDRAGQPTVIVDLPLASLAPGDYVVEVTATVAQGTARQLFAFRLAR